VNDDVLIVNTGAWYSQVKIPRLRYFRDVKLLNEAVYIYILKKLLVVERSERNIVIFR
jgi:hypothetical protein